MNSSPLHHTFADPPREFGIMPFWFWNDDLDEAEIVRQIHEFHAKGFGGFIPHARIGLSRRIGYLTGEWFRLVKIAVETAAQLDMKVVLYDEGSYPSGSAQGRVVAENPAYASRCLITRQRQLQGPAEGYWHPNPGRALDDKLVCVVLGRETAPGVLDPASLTLLPVQEPELVRYAAPAGDWRLVAVWNVPSGGTIRGVFAEEEDGHASAPPAGDILNPEAVACFIHHTHEQYYAHLGEHFGQTIVAMFTDEPMVLGRGAKRRPDPRPFTAGLLADLQPNWDTGDLDQVRRWLPALWFDCGPRTDDFRQAYSRAIDERLARVFYAAQSQWCHDHDLALTGHPAESNDFGALRYFQWPGQDMVWRWVTPGAESALEGPHSCAPKCASSAAALQGSRRNTSEALGAYGWQLTLDEAKWLLDWHLVRGNNLFYLHACFYSVRGRRAFESEPDIGLHNVWWPYFQLLGDYLRRICWLLADGLEVCDVAILTDPHNAAWSAAKILYQNQIDFIYLDEQTLEQARIEGIDADRGGGIDAGRGGRLCIGQQQFRAIICDPPTATVSGILAQFHQAGGLILTEWTAETLVQTLVTALGRDVDWPAASDLRVIHYRKAEREFYFFVNEGEQPLAGEVSLAANGALEYWDPLIGRAFPWPGQSRDDRTYTHLHLERRQSLVLAVNPNEAPQADIATPPRPGEVLLELSGPWQTFSDGRDDSDDNSDGQPTQPLNIPCPGDWARRDGWETFAGSLRFQTEFHLPAGHVDQPLFLDLGAVGDIAEVILNSEVIGICAWAPYIIRLDPHCRAGDNQLTVRVTNSIANFYEGLQLPSGLMGPVYLRRD